MQSASPGSPTAENGGGMPGMTRYCEAVGASPSGDTPGQSAGPASVAGAARCVFVDDASQRLDDVVLLRLQPLE